jgi:hypothetical protein
MGIYRQLSIDKNLKYIRRKQIIPATRAAEGNRAPCPIKPANVTQPTLIPFRGFNQTAARKVPSRRKDCRSAREMRCKMAMIV